MMNTTTANVTRKTALTAAIEALSADTQYDAIVEKLQSMLATEENRKSSPKKPKEITAEDAAIMTAIEGYLRGKPDGATVKAIREDVAELNAAGASVSPSKVTAWLKKLGAEPVKVKKSVTMWTLA